ncbi:MAG: hypothetical protein GY699_09320, partial [Desulfobacteraceae bacterium]|nr:hypothetical protein [Desulfobacteraceae bacterium]
METSFCGLKNNTSKIVIWILFLFIISVGIANTAMGYAVIYPAIPDQIKDKNEPEWTINLYQYQDESIPPLFWSVSDVDTDLVTVELFIEDSDWYLTITPVPDAVGSNDITLTLTSTRLGELGSVSDSQVITVTLLDPNPNNPPGQPSGNSPSDGAPDVSINSDLSWTCSDPDGDTLTYDLVLQPPEGPALTFENLSAPTYDPGTLQYDSTYVWFIYATDAHGSVTPGPFWSFTTESEPSILQFTQSDWGAAIESAGSINISVSRTGGSDGMVSVDFVLETGTTATQDSDFTVTAGPLTWADGDDTAKNIVINILNDSIFEPVETINLKLINAVDASIGAISTSTLAITSDDDFSYEHHPQPTGRIPDTGQYSSYTNTFGENHDYIINPPSYTKLDASGNSLADDAVSWTMVRDNVTGLIWE